MNDKKRKRWAAAGILAVLLFVGVAGSTPVGLGIIAVITQCPHLGQSSSQTRTQSQAQTQPSGPQQQAGNACQVVDWARQGGFTGQAMYNAAAIALAESSGNPDPKSSFTPDKNGGTYGLMQLNREEWNTWGAKYGDIGDPVAQMKASYDYSHGGRDFDPWCTSIASMNASGKNGCNGAGGATAGKFLSAVQACQGQGGGQVLGRGATSEQTQNAQAIIAEVKREGLPQQAGLDALETALAESNLRNLTVAVDHDSLGLFQQRPSTGWGSPQQVTNPQYATQKFLEALKGLPFASMSPEAASQAVQKSGAPQRYAEFRQQAQDLLNQLWDGAPSAAQPQAQGQPQQIYCPELQPKPQGQPETNPNPVPNGKIPFPVPAVLPAPGWKQQIPVPSWPAGLPGARVNPAAITPQCVAGALWAWAAIHITDNAFAHPPPMNVQSAFEMTETAKNEGYRVNGSPSVGDMVVFKNGSFYGSHGHVGVVVATSNDHYLVAEQNFMNTVDDLGSHWGTWDLRSISWPDSQASGFISSPPAG